MRRSALWVGLLTVFGLLSLLATSVKAEPPVPHQSITQYEGSQTCATCHPNAARQVAESAHYQQLAEAGPNAPGSAGKKVGMLASY